MATVLIVEDDAILRLAAETALQEEGYDTLVASNVDEAFAIINGPQPIDVLFTDIYLMTNAQGGCEIARQAVKVRPGIQVLYVTGFILNAQIRSLFVKDAGCLGKPYTDAALKDAIAALLQPVAP